MTSRVKSLLASLEVLLGGAMHEPLGPEPSRGRGLSMTAFVAIILAGLALRLYLSQYLTYRWDFNTWLGWGNGLYEHGFVRFYKDMWCDYMPGYMYVLWLLKKVQLAFPWIPEEVLYKLPANLADTAIAGVLYVMLRRITSDTTAKISALVYFFNPAVLSNSTFWGQVDSFHVLPILASFMFAAWGRFRASVALAAVAFMIKPQSIVIFPLIGYLAFRKQMADAHGTFSPLRFALLVGMLTLIPALVVMAISYPFIRDLIDGFDVFSAVVQTFDFIRDRFLSSYDQYKFSSLNAFNLWSFYGFWQSDQATFLGLTYQRWGTIGFAVLYAATLGFFVLYDLRRHSRGFELRSEGGGELEFRIYMVVTLIFFALFLVISRAHERHFMPTVVFFSAIAFRSTILWWWYALVSLYYVVNMAYASLKEYPIGELKHDLIEPYIPGIVLLASAIFVMLLYRFAADALRRFREGL